MTLADLEKKLDAIGIPYLLETHREGITVEFLCDAVYPDKTTGANSEVLLFVQAT